VHSIKSGEGGKMSKILGLVLLIIGVYAGYILAFASDTSGLPLRGFIQGLSVTVAWVIVIVLVLVGFMILKQRKRLDR